MRWSQSVGLGSLCWVGVSAVGLGSIRCGWGAARWGRCVGIGSRAGGDAMGGGQCNGAGGVAMGLEAMQWGWRRCGGAGGAAVGLGRIPGPHWNRPRLRGCRDAWAREAPPGNRVVPMATGDGNGSETGDAAGRGDREGTPAARPPRLCPTASPRRSVPTAPPGRSAAAPPPHGCRPYNSAPVSPRLRRSVPAAPTPPLRVPPSPPRRPHPHPSVPLPSPHGGTDPRPAPPGAVVPSPPLSAAQKRL